MADPLAFVEAGLACCALESAACRAGLGPKVDAAGEVRGTVFVVAGTVTHAMAPAIRARYDALDGPVTVVAFGVAYAVGRSLIVSPGANTLTASEEAIGIAVRPGVLRGHGPHRQVEALSFELQGGLRRVRPA